MTDSRVGPGRRTLRIQLVRNRSALSGNIVTETARILDELVAGDAALGWVDPPGEAEVQELLESVASGVIDSESALAMAFLGTDLVGFGYWSRYLRPTHRPHADLERIAVDPNYQGRGIGRALALRLIETAREEGIEQLTLDLRADNASALHLYRDLGFREYGRLDEFVAIGERRLGKVFMALDLRVASDD